jgi:hypothetical protein
MAIIYKIDKTNTIRIFDDAVNADVPFLLQDVHPEGHEWADKDEATAWVEQFIADREAAPAEVAPEPQG